MSENYKLTIMKELSIEEKAKAYEEVLAKVANCSTDKYGCIIGMKPFDLFSELKESEDERIIKSFIRLLKAFYDVNFPTPEGFERKDMIAWLEKQKTSDKALQYLKENHSPSEVSDFQAAMNIAVAKAYDKGYNDGLKNQGEQNPAWSEEDEKRLQSCVNILQAKGLMGVTETINTKWLKSLKDRYTWKPSDEQMEALEIAVNDWTGDDSCIVSLYNNLKKLREE